MICGNMVGSYSQIGKTFTLVDEDGNEIVGVVVDKETISNTFAGYAPYDNPVVSFTVVSPDIYHYDNIPRNSAPHSTLTWKQKLFFYQNLL